MLAPFFTAKLCLTASQGPKVRQGTYCPYSTGKHPPSSWAQRSIGTLSLQPHGFLETSPGLPQLYL